MYDKRDFRTNLEISRLRRVIKYFRLWPFARAEEIVKSWSCTTSVIFLRIAGTSRFSAVIQYFLLCPFCLTRCKFDLTEILRPFENALKSSDCLAPNTYLSLFFVHKLIHALQYVEFKNFLQVFFLSIRNFYLTENYFIPGTDT